MSRNVLAHIGIGLLAPAAAAVVPHAPLAIRVPLGLLLAIALQGTAVVTALFPRPTLTRPERLVLIPAASLAALVVSGLLMHAAGIRLTSVTWSWAAAAVTTVAAAAAVLRLSRASAADPPRVPETGEPGPRRRPRRTMPLAIVTVAAVALAVAAGWSVRSAERHDTAAFTALWTTEHSTAGREVLIGVHNQEGHPMQYRLEVSVAAQPPRQFTFGLADGEQWTSQQPAPPGQRVTVVLFKDGSADPYRTVFAGGSPA
ncbi:DUF1616 domain-containing protein [Dactylosporangium sp. CA-092794]|uniref:DUF1616 domain-containing protein n=1 Tax=Dactylosporangium sp. CA-092794 TaxID=3239929 RepID=UPI003D940A03